MVVAFAGAAEHPFEYAAAGGIAMQLQPAVLLAALLEHDAVADEPPAPDEEDLDGGLELVLVDGDGVEILARQREIFGQIDPAAAETLEDNFLFASICFRIPARGA